MAVTGIRVREQSLFYWLVYIAAFAVYALLRGVADNIGPGPFVAYPVVLDRILGFGTVPTLALQHWYTPGAPRWWDYLGLATYLTHYFAFPVTAVLTWRLAPSRLPRLLLSASLCLLIGVGIHIVVPTVPPWIAAQTGQLPLVHRPLVGLLGQIAPAVYERGLSTAGGNDVAAMPSMHVAAATFIALASWTGPLLVRVAGVTYLVLMSVTLVYFGEHYVVDAVVGFALSLGAWMATPRLLDILKRNPVPTA